MVTQKQAERQIRREKARAPVGSGKRALSEEGIRRAATARVERSTSRRREAFTRVEVGEPIPVSPARAEEITELERESVQASFSRARLRGDITLTPTGGLRATTQQGVNILSQARTIDARTQTLEREAEKRDIIAGEQPRPIREPVTPSAMLETPSLATIVRRDVPRFQETIQGPSPDFSRAILAAEARTFERVPGAVEPAEIPITGVIERFGQRKGLEELATAGLFGFGFGRGVINVGRDILATKGFSLVEGTAQIIAQPVQTIESIGLRFQAGPIGAGEVTGELFTGIAISKAIPKIVAIPIRGVDVLRARVFESRLRIPTEQLGQEFRDITRITADPAQAQLIPKAFDFGAEVGKARATVLGEVPGIPGTRVTRQTRLAAPELEAITLETGAIELRTVPRQEAALNILRGRLFQEARLRPGETQITLPRGEVSFEDFGITVIEPQARAAVTVGRGGLIAGRRGQASLAPLSQLLQETELRVSETTLRQPRSLLSVEPLSVPRGAIEPLRLQQRLFSISAVSQRQLQLQGLEQLSRLAQLPDTIQQFQPIQDVIPRQESLLGQEVLSRQALSLAAIPAFDIPSFPIPPSSVVSAPLALPLGVGGFTPPILPPLPPFGLPGEPAARRKRRRARKAPTVSAFQSIFSLPDEAIFAQMGISEPTGLILRRL